jgi:hypothetical protein
MKRALLRLLVLSPLVMFLIVGSVAAQERATIQALATVVSSLRVVGTNNLQFGTVTPGVNKSVDKTTIGFAGEWTIDGGGNAELAIAWVLPDSMFTSDTLSAMRISFSNTDASFGNLPSQQGSPIGTIDPNGPITRRLAAGGEMLIWIGGTVYPRISQTGGDYAADILISVAYTGN